MPVPSQILFYTVASRLLRNESGCENPVSVVSAGTGTTFRVLLFQTRDTDLTPGTQLPAGIQHDMTLAGLLC